MKTSSSNERFPSINVVPEFDPAKRNQTVDMWVLKVNECAQIYGWTERQIIHYALPKLISLAQKWYQGLLGWSLSGRNFFFYFFFTGHPVIMFY